MYVYIYIYVYLSINIYIYIYNACIQHAGICALLQLAGGPWATVFFCKMYLNWVLYLYRSAGIFEGRHIWEVRFGNILILHMFGISTHVYVYIYVYL